MQTVIPALRLEHCSRIWDRIESYDENIRMMSLSWLLKSNLYTEGQPKGEADVFESTIGKGYDPPLFFWNKNAVLNDLCVPYTYWYALNY